MGLWIWLACLAVLPTSAALAWVFNPAVTAHRHTAFGPAQRAARLAAMVGTKPTRSLSVIVPAYNEELRIGKMLEPTFAYLEQRARADRAFSFEVVVVDDGSRDGTCRVDGRTTQASRVRRRPPRPWPVPRPPPAPLTCTRCSLLPRQCPR